MGERVNTPDGQAWFNTMPSVLPRISPDGYQWVHEGNPSPVSTCPHCQAPMTGLPHKTSMGTVSHGGHPRSICEIQAVNGNPISTDP